VKIKTKKRIIKKIILDQRESGETKLIKLMKNKQEKMERAKYFLFMK